MFGKRWYVHTTAEKYFLFGNAFFFWDLKYLNTSLSFQGSDSFYKDIEPTNDTSRITKDSNWKERFITTSRSRHQKSSKRQAPWRNGQENWQLDESTWWDNLRAQVSWKEGSVRQQQKGQNLGWVPNEDNSKLASRHQVSEEVFVRVKRPELQFSAQRITNLS